MTSAQEALSSLFHLSESFFLGDESAGREIRHLQSALRTRGETVVEEGFLCMRILLQELVDGHADDLYGTLERGDWRADRASGPSASIDWPPESQFRTYPSLAELSRQLQYWVRGFVPVVAGLGNGGEEVFSRCLDSRDYQLATIATTLLGQDEFNYFWDAAQLRLSIQRSHHVVQKIELGRVMFERYSDLDALGALVVPSLIVNASWDLIADDHAMRDDVLRYLRELTVWDVATSGSGPRSVWPNWWR